MQLVDQEHLILSKIYESSLDAILLLDSNYTIIWSNRAVKTILGYSRQEINKKGIQNFLDAPSLLKLEHVFGSLDFEDNTSNDQYIELQVLQKNGSSISLEISVTATIFASQIYYICIARDISKSKELLKELDYRFQLAQLTSDISMYFNQLPYDELLEGTRSIFK